MLKTQEIVYAGQQEVRNEMVGKESHSGHSLLFQVKPYLLILTEVELGLWKHTDSEVRTYWKQKVQKAELEEL